MQQLELNVIESFRHAKTDIIRVQGAINTLARKQEEFAQLLGELRAIDARIAEQMKYLQNNVKENKDAIVENQKKLSQRPVIKTVIKKMPIIRKVPQVRTIVKRVPAPAKRARVSFVASKEGGKFHDMHCPFGKNIMPKTKLVFKTKNGAFNKGYKPCVCIRKY